MNFHSNFRQFFFIFNVFFNKSVKNYTYPRDNVGMGPGPEVIKLFTCSTQLSTKFILLLNVKMATIVGILTLHVLE